MWQLFWVVLLESLIMLHLPLQFEGKRLKEPFAEFIKTLNPHALLITCGLPASFKTTVSAEISKLVGYRILRSDLIRLEVLKNEDVFDAKVAGDMRKRLAVYDEMFRQANQALSEGGVGVILDATFVTQALRRQAAEIAAKHGVPLVILETRCPQELSLAIIRQRTKEQYCSNALTEEAYLANKAKFEAVDVDDLKVHYPSLGVVHFVVSACSVNSSEWYVTELNQR
jgi:predicted kinase